MHFVDTFMTGSATDAKENHFEDKTLLYWWFSWLLQIICVLFDQYHSICIFSFLVIKTSLHTSGREFKALDWPERRQSAGVQLCSSSQSRDSWRRCRKVVVSEQMGKYELFYGRWKSFTVVERTPHPINLASLPMGSGKMAKSEPASWNFLIYQLVIISFQIIKNLHC